MGSPPKKKVVKALGGSFERNGKKYIFEQVFRANEEPHYLFAVYDGEKVSYVREIKLNGVVYLPLKNLLIQKGVVLLPEKAEEFETEAKLIEDIRHHIHRGVQYPEEFELLDSYYVLITWNSEKLSALPYRRAIGAKGRGKSRWGNEVVGPLCFRPMRTSCATKAALFRLIEMFHGTMIMDEADQRYSELYSDYVKILNSGYKRGNPVILVNPNTFKLESFDVFGPKLIMTRGPFADPALEDRCVTHRAVRLTRRDIPKHLPPEYKEEEKKLRNQLFMWRLKNYFNPIGPDAEFDSLPVEPRIVEILSPIASIMKDTEVRNQLKKFARSLHDQGLQERRESLPAEVLVALLRLCAGGQILQVGRIADLVRQRLGLTEEKLSDKRCGSIIRRDLGLETRRERVDGGIVARVAVWHEKRIAELVEEYGIRIGDVFDENL